MKNFFLYLMAAGYMLAGLMHFIAPKSYLRIMPPWLPWHVPLVALSGVCEILGGVLLLQQSTRVVGAWFIIALLIAVFPANIQMAVNYYRTNNPWLWAAILRLPLQVVLVWGAWMYTN